MRPALSVVVPLHNEAQNVRPLVGETSAALAGKVHYEIVLVDDASTDETATRCRDLARDFPAVRLLRHQKRSGQSTALWNGVAAARAPWVGLLDGDLQNDPADLPVMLARRDQEADGLPLAMIVGHRINRHDSLVRRLSSRIANGVRSRILHDATPDTGCGIKLVSRDVYRSLPYFDHMHRFLPALVQQAGGRVLSVPVRHRPRLHGDSKYGISNRLWVGLVDLAGVAWLARRNRRVACSEELLHPTASRVSTLVQR